MDIKHNTDFDLYFDYNCSTGWSSSHIYIIFLAHFLCAAQNIN